MIQEKVLEFKKLEDEIKSCKKCELWKTKRNYVIGEGDYDTKLMFIGEAPGREEDLQGRPFVGSAGKLLTELIEKVIGLKREKVYIANVLKCRPPNNRDPNPDEIKACTPYLIKQIELIEPSFIVCLGRHSARFIFELFGLKFPSLTRVKGKIFKVITSHGKSIHVMATYHPAAVLYRPLLKDEYVKDFEKIAEYVKEKKKEKTLLDFT
ncbi:uracil-DNA glycosylase [Candidatus Bathyarchaeota archaeon]|nr:MAG: uracil-DNA glycosylase [Candidatus Bathyarchaeota archaeon]